MTSTILILLAALMGGSGVILASLAAHTVQGAGLEGTANILLFHAVAVLAGASLIGSNRIWQRPLLLALAGWVLGGVLFAGTITLQSFTGHKLFPMAAPTGGTLLIAAWLVLAIGAAGAALTNHQSNAE